MDKKNTISFFLALLITMFSFGAALALDDETPLFVTITAESCYTCQKLKPIVKNLEENYEGKVAFITLDVSSRNSIEESRETADKFGMGEFFNKNRSSLPKVGILCPDGKKVKSEFLGELNQEIYEKALDELLANSIQLCNL